MGKLVDLAHIYEQLEANLNATIANRNAMIDVLNAKIAIMEKKLELADATIKDLKNVIALMEKNKEAG